MYNKSYQLDVDTHQDMYIDLIISFQYIKYINFFI